MSRPAPEFLLDPDRRPLRGVLRSRRGPAWLWPAAAAALSAGSGLTLFGAASAGNPFPDAVWAAAGGLLAAGGGLGWAAVRHLFDGAVVEIDPDRGRVTVTGIGRDAADVDEALDRYPFVGCRRDGAAARIELAHPDVTRRVPLAVSGALTDPDLQGLADRYARTLGKPVKHL